MDARFYNSEDIDIERLANDVENVYRAQNYQAQQFGSRDQILVQLKKGGDFEAILGMQAAVSLTIQRTAGGVLTMIGQQRWLDKAALGTIGIVAFPVLWPLALTAGAGALRQASLGNQVLNMVDGLIRQQRPNIQIGPIPVQILPQLQQQWGQPPYQNQNQTPMYVPSGPVVVSQVPQAALPAASLHCPNCNTPYEPGDTFCTGCGRSLTPPKVYCPNCNTELKQGVAFCPKCGTSTYQAFQDAQARQAPQAPVPPAAAPPAYTPPPAQPTYTPPVQQAQPVPPPVYYAPPVQSTPPADPYVAPTVSADPVPPAPAPKPDVYYVPPVPQEPAVQPQPRVTMTPNTLKSETPAAPPKQPKKETQYYVPSSQAQAVPPSQAPTVSASSVPPKPIQAHPSNEPALDPNAIWGALIFQDGNQIQLRGASAIVGRYDHDLGGIQPEVDLGKMQGSDTISRIHAQIEHVGSSYTLTDLNSTNSTRINGKRLEPDKATPITDGDTLTFGKVTCTFKKL